MTEADAAEVARWLAVAANYDLSSYGEPEVTHEDHTWYVHFHGLSGQPGDHFSVALEAATRQSRVIPGR